jgi:streptogramin lyase/ABC-type dipeptide/oligopeptide/nickel transport system permease subunit/ABC-type dipeptide/oligopeptide/nickel transport system permease component
MSIENKRTVIAALRKVVFAGITLFAVWLILLALREVIPEYFISELNMRTNYPAGYVMADKITTGPDGNLWFTESNTNQIGKFSPANNKITEYNVPLSGTTNTDPDSITVGPDGNLWFTEGSENQIGKLSPASGKSTVYNVPTANAALGNIVAGPDGNLWFTEIEGNKIGKISPVTGVITEYNVSADMVGPVGITAGPDGNLWFTEQNADKIGKISPATGIVTEYKLPADDSVFVAYDYPIGITAGSDGNLWFTEQLANKIGKISPATGEITEYQLPSGDFSPTTITAGPDGNLWFVNVNDIGKISPVTGVISDYNAPAADVGFGGIISGPGGDLWFTTPRGISKISPETGNITDYPVTLSNKPNTWDWTKSFYTGEPVSEIIGQNLGATLGIIALIMLISLVMAGLLLTAGVFIGNIIKRPDWLVKIRGILRLVLVSSGAAIPAFVISTFVAVFIVKHQSSPYPTIPIVWLVFFCSLMPAWLLVQTGYRMLSNRADNTISLHLVQETSVRLCIRSLKMVGLIIVTTIIPNWFLAQRGLGANLMDYFGGRDFPVIFGIVWALVIIVVAAKLAAELIEIIYYHFTGQTAAIEPAVTKPSAKTGIPKGWLTFSLGLCVFILLVVIFGPLLAHNVSQINLQNILQTPSTIHLLGTDQLGRDLFSRLLAGIRTDLLIGLAAAGVVIIIAACWTMLAARCKRMNNWRGDTLEEIVLLPRDIICAFPWLVLLLLVISLPGNKGAVSITVLVGLVILPRTVNILQEAFSSLTEGKGRLQNVLRAISIAFIFTTAGVILYIALLGFLGFGIRPGTIELGTLASAGTAFMQKTPWLVIEPLVVLSVILIVGVMTGEALAEMLGFSSGAFWSKTVE